MLGRISQFFAALEYLTSLNSGCNLELVGKSTPRRLTVQVFTFAENGIDEVIRSDPVGF